MERHHRGLTAFRRREIYANASDVHPSAIHLPGRRPGTFEIYRMYHEELESLVIHIPTLRRAQFWMSFSTNCLKHLEVLQNVGMTRIDPAS